MNISISNSSPFFSSLRFDVLWFGSTEDKRKFVVEVCGVMFL